MNLYSITHTYNKSVLFPSFIVKLIIFSCTSILSLLAIHFLVTLKCVLIFYNYSHGTSPIFSTLVLIRYNVTGKHFH